VAQNETHPLPPMDDRFAVLVDVGCGWPEVVFVGDHTGALRIVRTIPDETAVSVQAVVAKNLES